MPNHILAKKTNRCIFNANIQQFVLGLYCFFICTDSGKLITFGEAEGGKLGLPEDADDTTIPQEVTGIKGKVTWVSCGGSHTVAVTGRLFHLLFFKGFLRERCNWVSLIFDSKLVHSNVPLPEEFQCVL